MLEKELKELQELVDVTGDLTAIKSFKEKEFFK